MPNITIEVDKDLIKELEKRAKKNFFSIKEQAEDIVRRSMINYSGKSTKPFKCDDKLVGIFSREKRGRKPKKKK